MNTAYFISSRLFFSKESKKSVSRRITNVTVAGIALSLAVMLIAIAVVTGFKREISNKVAGFGAHIQISNYDANLSFETQPIKKDQPFVDEIKAMEEVRDVQVYATKAGIIRTRQDIQGVVLKGIGSDYNWSFFSSCIKEGNTFRVSDTTITDKVLLSRHIASLLKLDVGDDFAMYFIQDPPRLRRFTVSGIYETGLMEFDRIYVFADIGHIQKLNGWEENMIGGFEVNLAKFKDAEKMGSRVADRVGYGLMEDGSRLKVTTIQEKYPQIFDWLNLQDMNVIVILLLMILVAGFNMISGLLILILDRTNMIGTLKALGAGNSFIGRIFIYQSGFLIIKAMLLGNLFGLVLSFLQKRFELLRLDQASYYLDRVPINLDPLQIVLLNLGAILLILLMLLIPSMIISRIRPVKAIRFN